jgi:hypothetical protein
VCWGLAKSNCWYIGFQLLRGPSQDRRLQSAPLRCALQIANDVIRRCVETVSIAAESGQYFTALRSRFTSLLP